AFSRLKAEEAAAIARGHDEVDYTFTTIGGQTGAVDEANVYVRLHPKAERDIHQRVLESRIREQLGGIGGATAGIAAGGFGGQKQIQIQLQGPDVATLNRLAEQVVAQVRQVPGAVDVGLSTKGQKPELEVVLNRGVAGSLGVTVGQVAQALRPAFAGIDVGDWVDPQNETRDVTVRVSPESRERVSDLQTLPLTVQGPQGPVTVPLGQVARVEQNLGPAQINRLDRERVINVEANTQGRPLSEVVADITTRLKSVPVPDGYTVSQGGETEDQGEVFGQIFAALGLAVMLMYFVLVVQFGSFLDPFAIMLSLPLSLIGVMLALLLTNSTLNIMSMIGVILLMGLVAKNAILLIDFAKWSHEAGMPLREALIEAGRTRLRPILMTTFALVAGMLPVALGTGEGADFRAPLGRAVIGGVITSTFLTLLVIPTIYEILSEWREWMMRRVFRRGAVEGQHAHPVRRPSMEPSFEPGD
ncbi:MAG TPA: efflux RND transporter permease subunit, partial [Longimicrobiaceae bacterium]|nr:efflux RND transporter permease subunit [Longimicrobiaceae bacterium]